MKYFKIFLIPFEYIYFLITSLRNKLYDYSILKSKKFLDKKIISVGNVSLGGSGKTPLIIFLLEELKKQNKSVAVVTRGYKSKICSNFHIVNDGDDSSLVGDEPYMIFKNMKCPVVISPKREVGVEALKNEADIILLDDAMQHRRIARDVNILSIDVGTKKSVEQFLSNRLLPVGFLRESTVQALKRTDLIVLNYRSGYSPKRCEVEILKKFLPKNIPVYEAFIDKVEILNCDYKIIDVRKNIVVFCAISKPESFFNTLKNEGFNILKIYKFLDHKKISFKDLEKIFKYANENNCDVICTEKDFVKLDDVWKKQCYFAKINVGVLQKDDFLKYIFSKMEMK